MEILVSCNGLYTYIKSVQSAIYISNKIFKINIKMHSISTTIRTEVITQIHYQVGTPNILNIFKINNFLQSKCYFSFSLLIYLTVSILNKCFAVYFFINSCRKNNVYNPQVIAINKIIFVTILAKVRLVTFTFVLLTAIFI